MQIAILGAGNVGAALGAAWARAGHSVTFGVRDATAARARDAAARAGGARVAAPADAVAGADVVLLAVPWEAAEPLVASLDLRGRVVVDATNPLTRDVAGLEVGHTASAGERIAAAAGGARVVKAFNAVGAANLAAPAQRAGPIPTFVAADDAEARATVNTLVRDAGLEPIDAGPLRNARLLEPLALLWIQLAYPLGQGAEIAFRLTRRE